MDHALDVFLSYAAPVGVRLSDPQRQKLLRGAEWLADAAAASGMSQYRDLDAVLLRAMGPALTYFAFDAMPRAGTVADVGSGNGALGATIALLAPELQIHLVDRAKRAYTAAELLIARMGLTNATAIQADITHLADTYDAVVFRALAPGSEALSAAMRVARCGGLVGALHRAGDSTFESPVTPLSVVGTRATMVPGLSMTCYRR